jgi:hypothetical protein
MKENRVKRILSEGGLALGAPTPEVRLLYSLQTQAAKARELLG